MLSLPDFKYKQTAVHIAGGSRERLRFKADNIVIEDDDGKIIFQHSCHRLFALFIIGDTTLTTPAIHHAVNFGFPIIIMNRNMKVVASKPHVATYLNPLTNSGISIFDIIFKLT